MKAFVAAMAASALVLGTALAQENPRPEHGTTAHPGHGPQGGPHPANAAPHPNNAMTNRPGMNRPDLGPNRPGHNDHVNNPSNDRPMRRPDLDRFHGNFNAERRFHAGPWRPPRDYHYRRWSYGERLPALYFAPNFWIASFGLYGLMAPPPDAVWVRSGPDALLVDRATGEIIRVQYGVFY